MKKQRLCGSWLSLVIITPVLAGILFSGGCSKNEPPSVTDTAKTEEKSTEAASDCPPGVVAMVDDRQITQEDADRRAGINVRLSGIKETDPDYPKKLQLAHKGAVDFLIQAYVLQAAATDTVEISTQELDTELLSWKMRVPTQAAWDEFLKTNGLTEVQFKEVLVKDLRIRKQMQKAAQREVPTPSPEEAQQFFDVNTLAFSWPYRVRYDEISWIAPPNLSQASREQARKGMEALSVELTQNPAHFDEILAREVPKNHWGPKGVKQPYVTVKSLPPQIDEALQSLVQGEISSLIETAVGYSLIRIASLSQSYDLAQPEIVDSIYTERCRLNLNDWINRQKQKHKVRICDVEYYRGGVAESTPEATAAPQR